MNRLVSKYLFDVALWWALTPFALLLRTEGLFFDFLPGLLLFMVVALPVKATISYMLGLHRRAWRKVGVRDLLELAAGILLATVVLFAASRLFPAGYVVPRSVPLIEAMLAMLALGGVRLLLRVDSERRRGSLVATARRRVLIVGAGEAGTLAARELLRHPESALVPVGYLDDDTSKSFGRIVGLPVLGRIEALPSVADEHQIDEVIIAVPSAEGAVVRRVVELARSVGVAHRAVPRMHDLLTGRVAISELREVDLEDLLRREPVRLEMDEIASYLTDRVVLITGAGGSIGSEIVRQVAAFRPAKIVLLGRGENSIFEVDGELGRVYPALARAAVIADVRDRETLRAVFAAHRPEVVFHAAAHKHVPLMEANPEQAVYNNVLGTKNLVELALEYRVERFVNVSTDKAVNPTSVMGTSKRVAELLVHRAAQQCRGACSYVSVRFGNVLGSRGSVIPLFKDQILRGGPVTVTHPEMTRYFMTIPEATQLVLQAGSMDRNGAVYVLDMGEPVRIVDLARDLIMLCGKEPEKDVEIAYTGMRPGEKLYEELLLAEEGTIPSEHEKIFVARSVGDTGEEFDGRMQALVAAADARDVDALKAALCALVPSYTGVTKSMVATNGVATGGEATKGQVTEHHAASGETAGDGADVVATNLVPVGGRSTS
jgi:FlaA1/EpsC-like NDP-sugar epimerase